jgi:hypothetical protein
VLDAGNQGRGRDFVRYLQRRGVQRVDYTLASHFHADHVGGLDELMEWYPDFGVAYDRGGSFPSLEFDEYAAAAGGRRRTLGAGDTLDLGESLAVEVLHGDTGDANENLNSLVLLVRHGEVEFLLGGGFMFDIAGPLALTAELNWRPTTGYSNDEYEKQIQGQVQSGGQTDPSAPKPSRNGYSWTAMGGLALSF